jgi:hypothetical protein
VRHIYHLPRTSGFLTKPSYYLRVGLTSPAHDLFKTTSAVTSHRLMN